MSKKLVIAVIIIALGVLAFYKFFQKSEQKTDAPGTNYTAPISETDAPKIVSTKPDPLEDNIVSSNQTIEITFNRSLENMGEFKNRIEPKLDYKVELSSDRKTVKITPTKTFELGITYTLFIGPDTKFDGVGAWGQEKIYHFKTVKYTGV